MELRVYSRCNDHKDMSLTIIRERAKLNMQSDQGYSDQVINTIPLSNGEDAVVHTKCATNAGSGLSPIGTLTETKNPCHSVLDTVSHRLGASTLNLATPYRVIYPVRGDDNALRGFVFTPPAMMYQAPSRREFFYPLPNPLPRRGGYFCPLLAGRSPKERENVYLCRTHSALYDVKKLYASGKLLAVPFLI